MSYLHKDQKRMLLLATRTTSFICIFVMPDNSKAAIIAIKHWGGDSRCNCLKTHCAKDYITLTFHSNIISQCMGIITCLQVWEKGDPFWERSYINQWSKSQVAVYARMGYKSQYRPQECMQTWKVYKDKRPCKMWLGEWGLLSNNKNLAMALWAVCALWWFSL